MDVRTKPWPPAGWRTSRSAYRACGNAVGRFNRVDAGRVVAAKPAVERPLTVGWSVTAKCTIRRRSCATFAKVFLGAALRGTSCAIAMESRTCLERSDRDIWNRAGVIGTALAVAAGICRTDDRNDRPGMPGPRRRLWSGQPAATSQSFHSLLPSNTPRGLLSGSIAVPAVHALQLCHPARAASSSLRICRSVTFNCSAACFWVICPWLASYRILSRSRSF